MKRPSTLTLALMIVAGASVVLVHADPFAPTNAGPLRSSASSASRRLFPNLGERDVVHASVEIQRSDGRRIRLVPGPDGRHQLFVDETLLGWADADAIEGLWSSLRMSTTLRAVAPGTNVGAIRGSIEVVVGDERLLLRLGPATSDGVGIFGVLAHEHESTWVVESELAAILDQEPEAWLSRRLLPLEPANCVSIAWEGRTLARGGDGLWRVTVGEPSLLLSTAAVETRLDRLFGAPLAPMLPRSAAREGALQPWINVVDDAGHEHPLRLGGECPDHPELRIVDRGPGLLGCVQAALAEPWPIAEKDAGLVEPQLIPYAYGRVLAIEQRRPAARRLRRLGGGWVIEEGEGVRAVEVSESEVYRWYIDLATSAVELEGPAVDATVDLVVESDSGLRLGLRCGAADKVWSCTRDLGPPLRIVRAELPDLAFNPETFADRRLLALDAGEVRSVELLPGSQGQGVRQSARLDLGVWRLDAPAHPDAGGALDEVRLEALIAALGALRAESWAPQPQGAPLRTIRAERTPVQGVEAEVSVDLYTGCLARVAGLPRAARLGKEACAALSDDLLFVDPLRYWLGRARTIEVERDDATVILRQGPGGAWAVDGGGDPAEVASDIEAWEAWRSAGIRRGEPPTPKTLRLRIRRVDGVAITADLGPEWLRIVGAPWYYVRDAGDSGDDAQDE